jgi:hypothetical protein
MAYASAISPQKMFSLSLEISQKVRYGNTEANATWHVIHSLEVFSATKEIVASFFDETEKHRLQSSGRHILDQCVRAARTSRSSFGRPPEVQTDRYPHFTHDMHPDSGFTLPSVTGPVTAVTGLTGPAR